MQSGGVWRVRLDMLWMKLFSVPDNKELFSGRVPDNNLLLSGTLITPYIVYPPSKKKLLLGKPLKKKVKLGKSSKPLNLHFEM